MSLQIFRTRNLAEESIISSIGGVGNGILNTLMLQGSRSRPDPAEKFHELDTDGNGGLDTTELSSMAKELSQMTGKSINVDDAMKTYDSNNDGLLSQDEMGNMMHQLLGPPPNAGSGVNPQQAAQAYQTNSGQDDLASLLQILDQNTTSSTSSASGDQISSLLDILNQSTDSSTADGTDDPISSLISLLERNTNAASTNSTRPSPEEMFNKLDTDGSGGLNQSELDVWAQGFSKMTGQTVDTTQMLSTYDADGDGELSKSEMDTMMSDLREKSGGPPPPPPDGGNSTQQVGQSGTDGSKLTLLHQLLEQYSSNLSANSETTSTD